jgi:flavin-dependent dehydrogenase
MQTHFDALIIGAGPAGSSAAILLATAGWSVALIEKQAFPRRKVCGECIAASNLPLLDALGIGGDFADQAGPELKRVALLRGAQSVYADLPPAQHTRHPWGRALGRETLDTLLLNRAQAVGATVLQPWAVQAISGVAGNHRCLVRELAGGRLKHLHAPVVILAHGSWEPLPAEREERRLARSGSDLLAFKANFTGAQLAAGLLPVLAFEGGYGGMVRADGDLLTLACCIRADRLDALRRAAPGRTAGEVVEDMVRRQCQGVAEALEGAVRLDSWLASGPLRPGVRLRDDDEVFRIGNAAGEAHPIIGEGISMALQSAWLLCAQFDAAQPRGGTRTPAHWQGHTRQRYMAEWRHHFVPRLRVAAGLAHLAMRPAGAAALMATLKRFPTLLTRGALWTGKVSSVIDGADLGEGLPHWPRPIA